MHQRGFLISINRLFSLSERPYLSRHFQSLFQKMAVNVHSRDYISFERGAKKSFASILPGFEDSSDGI